MDAVILLADAALQDQPGAKIHALGLGWSTTVTPTPPAAIVLFVKVPWDRANEKHRFSLELVDADGHAVLLPGPMGEQPLRVDGDFESGRPPGLPLGTPLDMALPIPLAPGMPLHPGAYMWRLEIDGETKEAWVARFLVRQSA